MTDIYYEEDAQFDSQKDKGNKMLVVVLFTIAILIVFIAGINFTNFSNALVPMRIRSVNTQKVLGESDGMLRGAMLVEAVVICLFSFAISLFIVRGDKPYVAGGYNQSRDFVERECAVVVADRVAGCADGCACWHVSGMEYYFLFAGIGAERVVRAVAFGQKVEELACLFSVCYFFCIDHCFFVYLFAESLYVEFFPRVR